MHRDSRHLSVLQPDIIGRIVDREVSISCSLALCRMIDSVLNVCAVTIYKRDNPNAKWYHKWRTVPGGKWKTSDGEILTTAAREFVEEVFGGNNTIDHSLLQTRLTLLLRNAWDRSSPTYRRLSISIEHTEGDPSRQTSTQDGPLKIHVGIRYLLDPTRTLDLLLIKEIDTGGVGSQGETEMTNNTGWEPLSVLKSGMPSWYHWGFGNGSVTYDGENWRTPCLYSVTTEIPQRLRDLITS